MSANFDPAQITAEEYSERIGALEAQLTREQEACSKTEAQLAWWVQGRDLFASGEATRRAEPSSDNTNGSKPVLREAILRIMRDGEKKTWKPPALMRELADRGWMPNGTHAEHIVRSRLAALVKTGDLRRVSYGTYGLPKGGTMT